MRSLRFASKPFRASINARLRKPGRTVRILCATVVLLLGAALFYATRVRDPVYEGKRLSKYLAAFGGGIGFGGVTMEIGEPDEFTEPGLVQSRCSDAHAYQAISSVGTNALPMLVRMLKSNDSRMRRWIWEKAEGNTFIRKHIRIKPPTDGFARQIGALAAFRELGPRAAPAIPKIIPLLDDPDLAHVTMVALRHIRPARERDILSLTNVLRIRTKSLTGAPPSLLHAGAILTLATFGPKAAGATPLLLEYLNSTNGEVQAACAIALLKIGAPPEKVVPLVLEHLPTTNPPPMNPMNFRAAPQLMNQTFTDHRNLAMNLWALGEYGRHARSALPILSNLQSYPVRNIQEAAREAMGKISADTNSGAR
ncbi:MAG: hypothetical protein L0Z50_14900 [Verrucomicrobiales bacterium]|nr:hypothetical protein [Verrucomicrobiales bacterium]